MYLPVDPNRVDGLSAAFVRSLCELEHCYVVEDGSLNKRLGLKRADTDEAERVVSRFSELGYVRIGTAKMKPVPPHFGLRVSDNGRQAELAEYIGIDCSLDRVSRDISLMVEMAFFEIKNLEVVRVPVDCSDLSLPGVSVQVDGERGCTAFLRI